MAPLTGKTVVLLESRMASEMAGLVRRHGGTPLQAPAMREVPLPQRRDLRDAIDTLSRGQFSMVVFLTGVGARALLKAATEMGKGPDVLAALGKTRIVCRGPKPLAVCRQNNLPVFLVAPEPNTTEELADALKEKAGSLPGEAVLLQHYGVANTAIKNALEQMGARVTDVSPYAWDLPEDVRPVQAAIEAMISGGADAVLFTSQQQARNLFTLAERFGQEKALKGALSDHVVVGSVGPVVTRTLSEYGVEPDVVPEHPKMGFLVRSLAGHFEERPAKNTPSARS